MTDFFADDRSGDQVRQALVAAYRANPQLWAHPVLPAHVLMAGSLRGFSRKEAEVILLDRDCLRFLNGLWSAYQENCQSFPPAYQREIDRERSQAGPQWNLLIAHQAGWGYSDDDIEAEWQEALVRSCAEESLLQTAHRGGGADAAAVADHWDVVITIQYLTVFMKQGENRLLGEIRTTAKEGSVDVILRWADGSTHQVSGLVMPGQALKFSVAEGHDGFPVSGSIRLAG